MFLYTKKECKICKRMFNVVRDDKKYCSYVCAQEARAIRARKEAKERKCCICGAVFVSTIESKKYCSEKCSGEGRKIRRKGKHKRTYKSRSRTKEPNRTRFLSLLERVINANPRIAKLGHDCGVDPENIYKWRRQQSFPNTINQIKFELWAEENGFLEE